MKIRDRYCRRGDRSIYSCIRPSLCNCPKNESGSHSNGNTSAELAVGGICPDRNVRELENKIKAAINMAEGKHVTAADLGISAGNQEAESLNLREVRQCAESKAIRIALMKHFGNVSRTAERLGVTRPTLYDLLNKYGLSTEAYSKKNVVGEE